VQLRQENLHPFAAFARHGQPPPTCWDESCWKVYLDNEEAIESAIRYVEENPIKEGKPRQHWPLVIPFRGVESNIVAYP
jgi:hypothetical protein